MAQVNYDAGTASAIRYDVVKNHAVKGPHGETIYNARVMAPAKSLRDVAEAMAREGSKFRASEIYQLLEHFSAVVTRLAEQGNAVNVGSLFRLRPTIRGTFTGLDDAFDRSRQTVRMSAAIGTNLRYAIARAKVVRDGIMHLPVITAVKNGVTGKADTILPKGTLTLEGSYLMFDTLAEDEGVFLNLNGSPHRGTMITLSKNVVTVRFENLNIGPGEKADLTFATRSYGPGLASVTYPNQIAYEAPAGA